MLQTIANNNIPFVHEHGELFSACYSLYVHKRDFPFEVRACEQPISVLKPQVTFPIVDTFTAIQVLWALYAKLLRRPMQTKATCVSTDFPSLF